jgi:hypothetical protein
MSWLTLRRSKASTEAVEEPPPSLPPPITTHVSNSDSHAIHNPSRRDSSEYELIKLMPKTENDSLTDVKRLETENDILKSQLQELRSNSSRNGNGFTEHYIYSSRATATASEEQGDEIVANSNDPSVSTRTQQRKSFLDAMINADVSSRSTLDLV